MNLQNSAKSTSKSPIPPNPNSVKNLSNNHRNPSKSVEDEEKSQDQKNWIVKNRPPWNQSTRKTSVLRASANKKAK